MPANFYDNCQGQGWKAKGGQNRNPGNIHSGSHFVFHQKIQKQCNDRLLSKNQTWRCSIEFMAMTWMLTDHVCSKCIGRILFNGAIYCCSNCGVQGHDCVESICCCGARMKRGNDANLRCKRNESPTPDFPGEIVVVQVR